MPDFAQPQELRPSLATRWEVSEDGRTLVFHLRRGVLHADGRPFTSADVAFSLAVLADPGVPAKHFRTTLDFFESVETPDPHTVVIHTRELNWAALARLGTGLRVLNQGWYEEFLPQHAEEQGLSEVSTTPGEPGFAEAFRTMRTLSPGTGPYMLRSRS